MSRLSQRLLLSAVLLSVPVSYSLAETASEEIPPVAAEKSDKPKRLGGFFDMFRPIKSPPKGKFEPYKLKPADKFLPTKEVVGSVLVANLGGDNGAGFAENAQNSDLIDLELRGLINSAVDSSDAIEVSKSEVRISQIGIWKELASYVPTLNVSVDVSRSGTDLRTIPSGKETSELKFSLNVPLFTSGKRHFALQAARSNRQAALGRAKAVRNDVAGQVISALLQYQQTEKTVALLGENVGSVRKLLSAVKNRHNLGYASEADIAYVQANLASLRSQRQATISNRDQLKAQLESLIQSPLNKVPNLPSLKTLIDSSEEQLVAQAIITDPGLSAAKHNAQAQKFASKSAVGSYLPQVNLYGQHDVALNNYTRSNQSTDWKVGVRLTMPLVDLSTVADIAEARERAQLAGYQASDTRRNLELSIRSLSREYQSATKQLSYANSRVTYLRKVAKSEAVKYDKGIGSLDKVLEQKQVLAQARIDALGTKMSAYWAAYQLLIATGRFEGGDFGLSDRMLLSQLR